MGFFSRLFGSSDRKSEEAAATKADSMPASELGLDARTAKAVLDEIDIDNAIAAHENWKLRLQNYLNGQSTEELRPEFICMDDRCDLGKWLYGPGTRQLGKYPTFSVLIARHKFFHLQASTVVALTQANQKDEANKVLEGSYRHASTQVVLLLKELKRGLGR
ncbi:CZB domain-containing protein [Rhodoferax sp. 4810]|nr:CZB domain-containing protein [Rhodoferax jenense]